jgi:hypothetical protein
MRIRKYLFHVMKLHFYTHLAPVFGCLLTKNTSDFPEQLYPIGIANGGELFPKK